MKKKLLMLLTALAIIIMAGGFVKASAAVEATVTVDGSKLTIHDNGKALKGIKYMYTEDFVTPRNWDQFRMYGKQNVVANSSSGYRSIKNHTDGYTFEVNRLGWYNFLFSYVDGSKETFYSVLVIELTNSPIPDVIVSDGNAFTVTDAGFNIRNVKWMRVKESYIDPYTAENTEGMTAILPQTDEEYLAIGLADQMRNDYIGYWKLEPHDYDDVTSKTYYMDASGWYVFRIEYDGQVLYIPKYFNNSKAEPWVETVTDGAIMLHAGDYTMTGCKYSVVPYTDYEYTTWNRLLYDVRQYPEINDKDYVSVKNSHDGQTIMPDHNGTYVFVLSYAGDGQVCERAMTLNSTRYIETEHSRFVKNPATNVITLYPELSGFKTVNYIYTGDTEWTYTTHAQFVEKGLLYPLTNGTDPGYLTVSGDINNLYGTTIGLEKPGWYTFEMTALDGTVSSETVEITQGMIEANQPTIEMNDMDAIIRANGLDLYEVLYMYTPLTEPYEYQNWSQYTSVGKRNTYINSSAGYRSIEATGDTEFTCFDLGYYNFILKYKDQNGVRRERHVTVTPPDLRVRINLQTLGGTVVDTAWEKNEDNPQLYERKVYGLVNLPESVVPKESETVKFDGWYTDLNYTTKVEQVTINKGDPERTYYAKYSFTANSFKDSNMYYTYGYGSGSCAPTSNYTRVDGVVNGSNIMTSYANNGFREYYQVNRTPVTRNSQTAQGGTNLSVHYSVGNNIFTKLTGNIYAARVCNVVGNYVEINYIIYNAGSSAVTNFAVGGSSDVKIGSVDTAPIYKKSDENGTYLQMEGSGYAFRLYLNDADYWIGDYSNGCRFEMNVFNISSDQANNYDPRFRLGNDSALAYNWQNITIPANQWVIKTVKLGVGTSSTMGSAAGTSVVLKANGGSYTDGTTSKTLTSTATKLSLSSAQIPVRTGYVFAGWNTSSVGSGTNYTETSQVSTCVLYALWTKTSSSPLYKIANHSYVTTYEAGTGATTKVGSAIAKINLVYPGGIVQQGTSNLETVSADDDFISNVTITEGYYLPKSIDVKVGSKWLANGIGYYYSTNEDQTAGTLIIYKEYLTGPTHVYIYGTQELANVPPLQAISTTTKVKVTTNVSISFTPATGYSYSYRWYITNADGSERKQLSSDSAKTATLEVCPGSSGVYYYQCRVKAVRNSDQQTSEVFSNVASVLVEKRDLESEVRISSKGALSVTSNPDGAKVTYTFFTDAEGLNKTSYENGATAIGERPIKPLESGDYYVSATIAEGKMYKSCITPTAVYDTLPDLPFLTREGNYAILNENGTNVTNIKYMYTSEDYSYSTWKAYTTKGKENKSINTKQGYRNVKQQIDGSGDPISMDGTRVQMEHVGYYTFLITFGGGTEVAYTLYVSETDVMYQKPYLFQPSQDGRLVIINDNDSQLVSVKYMYTPTSYTYSTWKNFYTTGKQNKPINSVNGYLKITSPLDGEGNSTLDQYPITLGNEGYYTFILGYKNGTKETYKTIRVSGDLESTDNYGLLYVNNGDITASTYNGAEIVQIKFRTDRYFTTGNVLHTNSTGTFNIVAIDENGYTYYLVAYVNTLDGASTGGVTDKALLLSKINAANTLYDTYAGVSSKSDATAPGSYVLNSDKSTFAGQIDAAQSVYDNTNAAQDEVDDAVATITSQIEAYKKKVFKIKPSLITYSVSGGNSIFCDSTTGSGYYLYRVRYSCDNDGNIVPSVWDNWTGFNSQKSHTLKASDTDPKHHYEWLNNENGIYTFIIIQKEPTGEAEYYDYAIIHKGTTEIAVTKQELGQRIDVAQTLINDYRKESAVASGTACITDTYWTALKTQLDKAKAMRDGITADASKYHPENDVIPMICELQRKISAAQADIHNKGAANEDNPVAPLEERVDISITPDNDVWFQGEDVKHVYVAYGNYKNWTQMKTYGSGKINASPVTVGEETLARAVYDEAVYNGEYTALVCYTDGSEQYKHFNISTIDYPFDVSVADGKIHVEVEDECTVAKAGYAYGANNKDISGLRYIIDKSHAQTYDFEPLGNGTHTVHVQINQYQYFVNIDVDGVTDPSIQVKAGGIGFFCNNIPGIQTVALKAGSFADYDSMCSGGAPDFIATNTWLSCSPGTYTIYYKQNGVEHFVEKAIGSGD